MGYTYKFRIGQTVRVDVKGDEYHGKTGKIVQQYHARNAIKFPTGEKHDYLDHELKNT